MRLFFVLCSLFGVHCMFSPSLAMAEDMCMFDRWRYFQGTLLLREAIRGPYVFTLDTLKIDADGAPNAYHPDDMGLNCVTDPHKGLDCPANAGYPNARGWSSILVPDRQDNRRAYVQADGPYKGYFLSQTALQNASKSKWDIQKYVNATEIPFMVFPERFLSMPGTGGLGDVGYAIHLESGLASPFIVADVGPPNALLGEVSIALAKALGGKQPNPRTGLGLPKGKVVFILFPYTKFSPAWPVSLEALKNKVDTLLNQYGGPDRLKSCGSVT